MTGIFELLFIIVLAIGWIIWMVLKSGYKITIFTKNKIEERVEEAKLEAFQEEHNEQFTGLLITLRENPELALKFIRTQFPILNENDVKSAAITVFKNFLNNNMFDEARNIDDYHGIDQHNLRSVMIALYEYNTKGGILELSPRSPKISLLENETAYEKLPCNWQKIHTYLGPFEDEIEQADILDSGNIYITDQRIFFVGKKGSETVYLNDITYMDAKEDALQFFRDEGLSEIFAFPTRHHARYAELVIRELMGR